MVLLFFHPDGEPTRPASAGQRLRGRRGSVADPLNLTRVIPAKGAAELPFPLPDMKCDKTQTTVASMRATEFPASQPGAGGANTRKTWNLQTLPAQRRIPPSAPPSTRPAQLSTIHSQQAL